MARKNRKPDPKPDAATAAWIDAINRDDVAAVERLLAAGGSPNRLIALPGDRSGDPALIMAVNARAEGVVRALLRAGAAPDTPDYISPLAVAIHRGSRGMVDALLEAGARLLVTYDLGQRRKLETYPATSCVGESEASLAMLEMLVERARAQGVDVRAMLAAVVSSAIEQGDPVGIREAVRVGARIDDPGFLSSALHGGPATLRAILQFGKYPPKVLVEEAAKVIWNNDHACENMKVLASQGISPRSYGEAALVMGCHYDRGGGRPELDAFEYLLKAGVSPNARGGEPLKGALGQWTDLKWGCDWELAALLIRYGADLGVLPKETQRLVRERLARK